MEIERKFLINEFPTHLEVYKEALILQSYLSTDPEFRIRSYADKDHIDYIFTMKSNGDLCRDEEECYISEDIYTQLKDSINKPAIVKEYCKYRFGDLFIECSLVDPFTPNEFKYAEIEFKTIEDANNFIPPDFFGLEITKNKEYKMKNYWRRTRLES